MTGPCWRCGRTYDLDRTALPASWEARSRATGIRTTWALLCGPCTYAAAAATQLDAQSFQPDRGPIRVQAVVGR